MAVSSQGDDELIPLSTFLANYPTKLHYKRPSLFRDLWVFWSQIDETSPYSSPFDPNPRMTHKKIRSALSRLYFFMFDALIQFWAPVKIGGRRVLTTSDQPFALYRLDDGLEEHRLRSLKYQHDIDVNNFIVKKNPKIISGAPARAFLNRVPEFVPDLTVPKGCPLVRSALACGLRACFVLPVFSDPSQRCCIGVFECYIMENDVIRPGRTFESLVYEVKKQGLYPFDAKTHISSKNICGLKDAKNEVEIASQVIVESHGVQIVQVWIAYEDENHVTFSSSLDDNQKKRLLGFRLTACCVDDVVMDYKWYFKDCCNIPLVNNGMGRAESTLRNNEAQFYADFSLGYGRDKCFCFTICLRNNKTSDLLYYLEFLWNKNSDYIVTLESLFSTLKRYLPSFNLASGAQLGNELRVIRVDGSTGTENGCFRILEVNGSSSPPNALDEGERSVVLVEKSLNIKTKMAEKELPLEKMEQQLRKTITVAAQTLNGDDLHVINVDDSTGSGNDCLQILEENGSSSTPNALDEGKRSVVLVEESRNKECKTAKKELPLKKMEQQFGKTMKVAAQNLGVSMSTLKRYWNKHVADAKKKDHDFNGEWPGPSYKKRKVNDPDNNHRGTNIENNGAIEDPLSINGNKDALTIKAEYAGDMIKFNLSISSATFGAIEKKIKEDFGLNPGTYKLKYCDEDGDWILLKSDKHMKSCIESLRSHRTVIRLLVTDIQPK